MRRLLASALVASCAGAARAPEAPPPAAPPTRCPGDRTPLIADQDDVARFAACTSFTALTIRTGAVIDLSPLEVTDVLGDLTIGPSVALDAISLPALRRVGGALVVVSNGSLRTLVLPRLEHARRIAIEANSALEVIDLKALEAVDDELAIAANPELVRVDAAALAHAKPARIEGNSHLSGDQVEVLRTKTVAP
jgi:hypothetical protein